MQSKLKPLARGSSKQTGNISDAELARVTKIPKDTLIGWSKTDKDNWRFNHYWFLKSLAKLELESMIEKSKDFIKL